MVQTMDRDMSFQIPGDFNDVCEKRKIYEDMPQIHIFATQQGHKVFLWCCLCSAM